MAEQGMAVAKDEPYLLQVTFTDQFVGETHCMRIDVTDTSGNTCTAIQGHDSFRR